MKYSQVHKYLYSDTITAVMSPYTTPVDSKLNIDNVFQV